MVDFVSKENRSKIMSSIKSKDTELEKIVRKHLLSLGLHYKANYKILPGSPDIVFTAKKVAIFCDGEFWHGHDYKERRDKLSAKWRSKIENNMKRDKKNNRLLRKMGWKVIRLREHKIRNNPEYCIRKIRSLIDKL